MRPTNSKNVRGGGLVSILLPVFLHALSIHLTYVKGFKYSSATALHRELLRRVFTPLAVCALVVALCAALFSFLSFFLFLLLVQLQSLFMFLRLLPEVHFTGSIMSFRFISKAPVVDAALCTVHCALQ